MARATTTLRRRTDGRGIRLHSLLSILALAILFSALADFVVEIDTDAMGSRSWATLMDGRSGAADAATDRDGRAALYDLAPRPGQQPDGVPARQPSNWGRADTLDFGYYTEISGGIYAVQGEVWTWDHGAADPLEGWISIDDTANPTAYWRHLTAAVWGDGHGNPEPAPLIHGQGCVWLGAFQDEAEALCWAGGLGYGNSWCQRLVSPEFTYSGADSVLLAFHYWSDTEPNYDYSRVVLAVGEDRVILNDPGFHGQIGFDGGLPQAPEPYSVQLGEADLGGGGEPVPFRIELEFVSDGGWSDEDGYVDTEWGAWAVDDLGLSGSLAGGDLAYDWEDGLQGWAPSTCPGTGSFFGVAHLSQYVIQDPCQCELSGNVIEFHDEFQQHPGSPGGQKETAWSPPVDRTQIPNYTDYNQIFCAWDMYAEMPQQNGVFYRAGWSYYPYVCPATGEVQWSPRTGIGTWYYVGDQPACYGTRNVGTDWGVPVDCEQIRFAMEIYSSCDAFGIPETVCTGQTNATPVMDNVRIRMTHVPNAPVIAFAEGTRYQDGFGQGLLLSTTDPGNADITYDLSRDDPVPDRLGDSLHIKGPAVVGSTNRWEARLWFRLARTGPRQGDNGRYNTWINHPGVNKGYDITGGQFTYSVMDSMQLGTLVSKNKFNSYYREDDPGYLWGGGSGDISEGNEIIPDLALTPGTKVEYFITANYICNPAEYYYLPDTSGGNYLEFEILPSFRRVDNVDKFPCLLYVDAWNQGVEAPMEEALNRIYHGAGPWEPVPDPALWDRYDYQDATSSWNAPLFRNISGNAGATIPQLLGYRWIVVLTGEAGTGCMESRDWEGFADWLSVTPCSGNRRRQGILFNGDNIATIIDHRSPAFLSEYLQTQLVCSSYREEGCPPGETENDENYCLRLDPVGDYYGYQCLVPLDLVGNGCPALFDYDVLAPGPEALGNQVYRKVGSDAQAEHAQILFDSVNSNGNYRAMVDGYSFHHLSLRDSQHPDPETECSADPNSVADALEAELREALRWVMCVDDPLEVALGRDPCGYQPQADYCSYPVGVPGDPIGGNAAITALHPARPNPFNPRAVISYSLAQAGPVTLRLYDVSGREVRVLVDGVQEAGSHELVWDGSDGRDRQLPAGVYWCRMEAGEYASNRKLVVLR